jgi:CheY-like chemotaxis protein
MEDITRITELREQINMMKKIHLLSDITTGYLHTLNNTLNVILNKTQLIMHLTEKDGVSEGIQIIENSAMDLAEMTKRLQKFISDKDNTERITEEYIVDIIEDAIELSKMQFKVEDNRTKRSIHIEKKYFSRVSVKTNTTLLREIIISIILRISACIPRKGTIHLTLKESQDLSLLIQTEKEEDVHPAEPFTASFSQLDIRQIAEQINVTIIEEESSDLYSMTIVFPRKMIIKSRKKDEGSFDYKLRDLDILIVEDEKPLQKILHELFDNMGNRVYICETGEAALEEFRRKNYQMVITDYGMAGITGVELAARVKEINEQTITVLLSGWMLGDIEKYQNIIDLFLQKPFKLDDLLQSISSIFKNKFKKQL